MLHPTSRSAPTAGVGDSSALPSEQTGGQAAGADKTRHKRLLTLVAAAIILALIAFVAVGAATKKSGPSSKHSNAAALVGATATTESSGTSSAAATTTTQPSTLQSVENLLKSSNLGVCYVSSDSGQSALGSNADINLFLPSECGNPTYYGPGIVLSSFPSASSAQSGAIVFAKINGFDPWILNNLVFNGQDLTSDETNTFHGVMQSIGATLVPSVGAAVRYEFGNNPPTTAPPTTAPPTTTTTAPPPAATGSQAFLVVLCRDDIYVCGGTSASQAEAVNLGNDICTLFAEGETDPTVDGQLEGPPDFTPALEVQALEAAAVSALCPQYAISSVLG